MAPDRPRRWSQAYPASAETKTPLPRRRRSLVRSQRRSLVRLHQPPWMSRKWRNNRRSHRCDAVVSVTGLCVIRDDALLIFCSRPSPPPGRRSTGSRPPRQRKQNAHCLVRLPRPRPLRGPVRLEGVVIPRVRIAKTARTRGHTMPSR